MSLLNISEKENFLSSSPRPNPLSNLKKNARTESKPHFPHEFCLKYVFPFYDSGDRVDCGLCGIKSVSKQGCCGCLWPNVGKVT